MTLRAVRRSPLFQGLLTMFLAVAVPASAAAAAMNEVGAVPGPCAPGVCTSVNPSPRVVDAAPAAVLVSRAWVTALATAKNKPVELLFTPVEAPLRTTRPGLLVPMYASLGALHAMDIRTTLNGRGLGARETNPLAGTTGRLVAVKAASMAGTIAIAERAWKKNPAAAIALMVAANSAYAAVVAHNYRVIRQQR